MTKFLWTIGGGWDQAASIEELKEFYQRSGNMQGEFVAIMVDDRGNKVNITSRITDEIAAQQAKTRRQLNKKWWEFWK